jgi:hypothetical protein
MSKPTTQQQMDDAAKALEALDLRSLKAMRRAMEDEIEKRTTAAAGGGDYARAVRDCLIDCQAFLQSARKGQLRSEHMGQLDTLLADMRNLIDREDVPAYNFKKGT